MQMQMQRFTIHLETNILKNKKATLLAKQPAYMYFNSVGSQDQA
jgi:hypothetical protein